METVPRTSLTPGQTATLMVPPQIPAKVPAPAEAPFDKFGTRIRETDWARDRRCGSAPGRLFYSRQTLRESMTKKAIHIKQEVVEVSSGDED